MTVREAAKKFEVPKSSLHDRATGAHGDRDGRPAELSMVEERMIVERLKVLAAWGFPVTSSDLRHLVKSYIDKKGQVNRRFTDNLPTTRWVDRFLGRHPDLTLRMANPIKRARAKVSREEVQDFITHWEKTIEGVPPSNIFNYDETNLKDDPGAQKCIFRKGTKYCEKVQNTSKSATSIMFCGSADGKMLPPMVVYKAANVYERWKAGGPKGAEYSCSKSGWFDSFQFQRWFFKIMLPAANRLPGKKVILGDNLASHLNKEVIDACKKYDIAFCCLPPNSTDKLQPLDVAIFGPLKEYWRQILRAYKAKYPNEAGINKKDFPALLKSVLEKAALGRHLPAGFEKCGLFPVSLAKAVERLPHREMEMEEEEQLINDVFGERLEQLRGVDPEGRRRKGPRGKKVDPGKSFTIEEEEDSDSNMLEEEEGILPDPEEDREDCDAVTVPVPVTKANPAAASKKRKGKLLQAPKRKPKKPKKVIFYSSSEEDILSDCAGSPAEEEEEWQEGGVEEGGVEEEGGMEEEGGVVEVESGLEGIPVPQSNIVVDSDDDMDVLERFLGLRKPPSRARNAAAEPVSTHTYKVGSYVAAVYDKCWYIAQVEGEEEEVETKGFTLLRYMNRMGKNQFTWDKVPDILKTNNVDILLETPAPVPVSSRYYGFNNETLKTVESLFMVRVVVYFFDWHHYSTGKGIFFKLPVQAPFWT